MNHSQKANSAYYVKKIRDTDFISSIRPFLPPLLLISIAALAYIVLAPRLGVYNDDWYLLYAGTGHGVEKFHDIFSIDRPFRGYFVGWMFELLGVNSLLYSIGAFIMRCIGALSLLWILRIVWPSVRRSTYLAALLLVIYPGFLDQPNAIDFQSHQWSFALALLSIGCTLQSVKTPRIPLKVLLLGLSLGLQLIYLLLMEYYIGLEVLRILLLAALLWKRNPRNLKNLTKKGLLYGLPLLVGVLAFMFWRTQMFEGGRQTTDINAMFTEVGSSPILRLLWMGVFMFKDLLNVIVFAWTEPIYQNAFSLRLKLILLGFGLSAFSGLLAWVALNFIQDNTVSGDDQGKKDTTAQEMMIIGLLAAAGALFPIHFAGRSVIFQSFSRFSLTAAVGASMFLAAIYMMLNSKRLKMLLAAGLVSLAVLAHTGNTLKLAENWETVRNFWWQVTWRIPQIKPGTLIIADYANTGIAEDYFVWGPANLIYYPQPNQDETAGNIITAATLDSSSLASILMEEEYIYQRRSFRSHRNFANLLVLSMPTEFACVHTLDGDNLELSEQSRSEIIAAAPYSSLDRILLDETLRKPPESIFGQEPSQSWCYYYQKASLARQMGDWDEVVRLGEVVLEQDLRPYDWIEWMPFIQGFATRNDEHNVETIGDIIRAVPFYRHQACQVSQADLFGIAEVSKEGHQLLVDVLCETVTEIPLR